MSKFIWSQDKLTCCRLGAVRNFKISQVGTGYQVVVWYSDKESLPLGIFPNPDAARELIKYGEAQDGL